MLQVAAGPVLQLLECVGLLMCVCLAAACGADTGSAGAVTVRDSAGITIIESAAPAWGAQHGWRLAPAPTLDIGVIEGDPHYQLHEVSDAARLPDGAVVVANAGSREVRLYDAEGRFVWALGGDGEGPGEFRSLEQIALAGSDSILIFDSDLARITVLDTRGRLLATIPLQNAPPYSLDLIGRAPDGSFVVGGGWSLSALGDDTPRRGVQAVPAPILRFASGGALLDTIGVFRGLDVYFGTWGGGMIGGLALFGRRPTRALYGTRVYVGTEDKTAEITVLALDGQLRRLIRNHAVDLGVTERAVDSLMQALLTRTADRPDARRQFREYLEAQPFPEHRAAFSRIAVDPTGYVWAADAVAPPDDPLAWTVYDREGRLLGRVVLPHRFRVLDIGTDYVLGRWQDELDVEHVRLYELLKPGD